MPRVATVLSRVDRLGTLGARTGFTRNSYKITPGLYAVGSPDSDAPVIVTANYKLTFDAVRTTLPGQHLWLLVIDTRGINVWCAAGKGTFSAEEIAYQVQQTRLSEVVNHRRLILPQLAAPGVAAPRLKTLCGFRAVYGPVRIEDLPAFLRDDLPDSELARTVTFSLNERASLVPVEICMMWKPLAVVLLAALLLSGIGPALFSAREAVARGGQFALATFIAVICGSVVTPFVLPWLPFRQFWIKGLLTSAGGCLLLPALLPHRPLAGLIALCCWNLALGSYLAMNFTGSTPFTSLSGVESEMRRGLAVQLFLAALAIVLWLIAPFS